jgi:hypothetical protein
MQIESKPESATAAASRTSRQLCPEVAGLVLLALALLFNAFLLAPEARIERVPMNDLSFHVGASQVLGEGIARGAPFMEPWASQWSLGFPLAAAAFWLFVPSQALDVYVSARFAEDSIPGQIRATSDS